eukprot:CFRG6339T1
MNHPTLPPSPNWYGPHAVAGDKWSTRYAYCARALVVVMDTNPTSATYVKPHARSEDAKTSVSQSWTNANLSLSLTHRNSAQIHPMHPPNTIRPRMLNTLAGHTDRVVCVEFNPHENQHFVLASGSDDKSVRVWDTELGVPLATHAGVFDSAVIGVAWSRFESDLLLVVDQSGTLISLRGVYRSSKLAGSMGARLANVGGGNCAKGSTRESEHNNLMERKDVGSTLVAKKTGIATCISASRDASYPTLVALGYKKGSIVVYDHAQKCVIYRLSGHTDEIQSLSWRPHDRKNDTEHVGDTHGMLVSGAKDKTVRVWDLQYGKLHKKLNLPKASSGGGRRDRVWMCVQWDETNMNANEEVDVNESRADTDGCLLAALPNGEIIRWKLGANIHTSFKYSRKHTRNVFNLVGIGTHTTTPMLISSAQDRALIVWDAVTSVGLCNIPSLGGFAYVLAPSPLEPTKVAVAVGDGALRVWSAFAREETNVVDVSTNVALVDVITMQRSKRKKGNNKTTNKMTLPSSVDKEYECEILWKGLQTKIMALAWLPMSETDVVFGTEEGHVGIYDVSTHRFKQFTGYHKGTVYRVTSCPPIIPTSTLDLPSTLGATSGIKLLWSLGADGVVFAHDVDNPSNSPVEVKLDEDEDHIANCTPKSVGAQVVQNGIDIGPIKLGISDTLKKVGYGNSGKSKNSKDKKITDVSFHPDGRYLSVGRRDGSVTVYNAQEVLATVSVSGSEIPSGLVQYNAHSKSVNCVVWHPKVSNSHTANTSHTCHCMMASCSDDATVCVYTNVEDDILKWKDNQKDRLGKLTSGKNVSKVSVKVLKAHTHRVVCLAWSTIVPGRLVSASFDQTVQVWDVFTESPISNYRGHCGRVYSVVFSPFDGDVCMSGSDDQTVRVWRVSEQTHNVPPPKKNGSKGKKGGVSVSSGTGADTDPNGFARVGGDNKQVTGDIASSRAKFISTTDMNIDCMKITEDKRIHYETEKYTESEVMGLSESDGGDIQSGRKRCRVKADDIGTVEYELQSHQRTHELDSNSHTSGAGQAPSRQRRPKLKTLLPTCTLVDGHNGIMLESCEEMIFASLMKTNTSDTISHMSTPTSTDMFSNTLHATTAYMHSAPKQDGLSRNAINNSIHMQRLSRTFKTDTYSIYPSVGLGTSESTGVSRSEGRGAIRTNDNSYLTGTRSEIRERLEEDIVFTAKATNTTANSGVSTGARVGESGVAMHSAHLRAFLGMYMPNTLLSDPKAGVSTMQPSTLEHTLSMTGLTSLNGVDSADVGDLTDFQVAIAAGCGREAWVRVCKCYAQQLIDKGEVHKAVSYFLVAGEPLRAVKTYQNARLYRDAFLLARLRLPQTHPQLTEILHVWSSQCLEKQQYAQAAKCQLLLGNKQAAAIILSRFNGGLYGSAMLLRDTILNANIPSSATKDVPAHASTITDEADSSDRIYSIGVTEVLDVLVRAMAVEIKACRWERAILLLDGYSLERFEDGIEMVEPDHLNKNSNANVNFSAGVGGSPSLNTIPWAKMGGGKVILGDGDETASAMTFALAPFHAVLLTKQFIGVYGSGCIDNHTLPDVTFDLFNGDVEQNRGFALNPFLEALVKHHMTALEYHSKGLRMSADSISNTLCGQNDDNTKSGSPATGTCAETPARTDISSPLHTGSTNVQQLSPETSTSGYTAEDKQQEKNSVKLLAGRTAHRLAEMILGESICPNHSRWQSLPEKVNLAHDGMNILVHGDNFQGKVDGRMLDSFGNVLLKNTSKSNKDFSEADYVAMVTLAVMYLVGGYSEEFVHIWVHLILNCCDSSPISDRSKNLIAYDAQTKLLLGQHMVGFIRWLSSHSTDVGVDDCLHSNLNSAEYAKHFQWIQFAPDIERCIVVEGERRTMLSSNKLFDHLHEIPVKCGDGDTQAQKELDRTKTMAVSGVDTDKQRDEDVDQDVEVDTTIA